MDDFTCFVFCSTKISEKSDMAKSWATFCCPGCYKENQIKVLRNLGLIINVQKIVGKT